MLLVSNKEGGFVSLPEDLYRQEADIALEKHFKLTLGVCPLQK